jgi:hypothetical protein
MKIRITTDLLAGYQFGQIVDISVHDNTPMERFWRDRLKDNDGICEVYIELNIEGDENGE